MFPTYQNIVPWKSLKYRRKLQMREDRHQRWYDLKQNWTVSRHNGRFLLFYHWFQDSHNLNFVPVRPRITKDIICDFRAMTSSVQLSLGESKIPNSYDFPFYECNQPNLYIFHVDYSGLGIWIISGRFQFLWFFRHNFSD